MPQPIPSALACVRGASDGEGGIRLGFMIAYGYFLEQMEVVGGIFGGCETSRIKMSRITATVATLTLVGLPWASRLMAFPALLGEAVRSGT